MVNKEIENLVTFTQQKWAKTVLEIGKAFRSKSDLENLVSELLDNIYAFNYCEVLFKWLKNCEKIFGFDNTREYSRIRVYAFLAERFLSYWFKKNSNYLVWPLKFHDITNDNINF